MNSGIMCAALSGVLIVLLLLGTRTGARAALHIYARTRTHRGPGMRIGRQARRACVGAGRVLTLACAIEVASARAISSGATHIHIHV